MTETVAVTPLTSPIILGGIITIALAILGGIQIFIVNKMNSMAQAASELRAADIRRKEKEEDYKRQDQVAEKAAEAAKLLLESQRRQIVRQDAVAEQVSLAAKQAAGAAGLLVEAQKATNSRQDMVADLVAKAAKQAADAAELLVKAQAETIHRTDEVARIAAEADVRVQQQLIALDEQGKKIHVLVNSDMTAARTAERNSLGLLLIALKKLQGDHAPASAEQEEIVKVEKRVAELDQILADRYAAQMVVDAEAKAKEATALPDRRNTLAAPSTEAALKEIVKNTAETAKNTAGIQPKGE